MTSVIAGGCLIGIGAFHQHTAPKEREGRRPAFEAGYVHDQYSVVALALSNLDYYWALKVMLDALRGMLPCTDPNCTHPLRRVDIDANGSFVYQRACPAFPLRRDWYRCVKRLPPCPICFVSCASTDLTDRTLTEQGIRSCAVLCHQRRSQCLKEHLPPERHNLWLRQDPLPAA